MIVEQKKEEEIRPLPELVRKESVGKMPVARPHFKKKPFICFEDAERKKKIDEYGEVALDADKEQWKKLNPTDEVANAAIATQKQQIQSSTIVAKLRYNILDNSLFRKPEYTGNFIYSNREISVIPQCKFICINFEGIYDADSLLLTIKYIQPKKLILFNGAKQMQGELKVNNN